MPHPIRLGLALCALLALNACGRPFTDVPRPETRFEVAGPEAPLVQASRRAPGAAAGHTTVFPLSDGNDALGVRLQLIAGAETSLDLQYFLLKPDIAGLIVGTALLRAADRGVRVRLLLDDIFTTARDDQIALLAAHPNIEVRLFNPLRRGLGVVGNYLTDFARVNRRMHNKALIADGVYAVVGGRNLADEYYDVGIDHSFADFELLLTGPAVAEIGGSFDEFWNDPAALPHAALAPPRSEDELATIRVQIAESSDQVVEDARYYAAASQTAALERMRTGRGDVATGPGRFVSDGPDKLRVPVRGGPRVLAETLLAEMNAAKNEVILITPYFVPEDWGRRLFTDLAARGVAVHIVTNSLAATNHPYVHGGYKRHRVPLLEAGVSLYEVRADAPAHLADSSESVIPGLTMHTKLAMIDGRTVYVGSMNFDPRSIKINTENGLFLESPAFGAAFRAAFFSDVQKYVYRLSLDADGGLLWTYAAGGGFSVETDEPGAGGWAKFLAWMTEAIGIEGQL